MEYNPYLYCQYSWPFKIIYNQYHDKHYSKGKKPEKLLVVNNKGVVVQGMWRMQLVGELHSRINVRSYDDNTNWEYYDEVMFQTDDKEEREKFRCDNYRPETYDEYFEDLAGVAAEIGCERAEIKCLIKSLIFKYSRVEHYSEFPHSDFNKLYERLVTSTDIEKLRVAERLSRYHAKQYADYISCDCSNRIWKLKIQESANLIFLNE